MKTKQVNKQERIQTSNQNMKANKNAKQLKENTTSTPTLMVHGHDHVKWYFQCSHRCIGRPMWVEDWSASNPIVRANIQERYNSEDNHTLCFKVPKGHKWVHVHDGKSVDLSWCFVTLRANLKRNHTLDCDMQENETNKYILHCTWVLAI